MPKDTDIFRCVYCGDWVYKGNPCTVCKLTGRDRA